jgi:hypothetical protein
MMKKEGMMNHASGYKDACCCCGDSCEMKEGAHHTMNASSDKHESCCGGDSCNMKDMKKKTGQ